MTIEERIERLESIEAIRQLQAKYQRCLDMRDFEGLASCFTEDAVSAYDSGEMTYKGRAAIVKFLRETLTSKIICSHLIHGGEIELDDESHATGLWYLEDYLLHRAYLLKMHGAAVYTIDYRKEEEGWRICHIGYSRAYQYFERRPILNLLTLAVHSKLQNKLR